MFGRHFFECNTTPTRPKLPWFSMSYDRHLVRRRATRKSSYERAHIVLGRSPGMVACEIADISETGACLEVASPAALPDEFAIILSHDTKAQQNCRVVWRSANQVGVTFVTPLLLKLNGSRNSERNIVKTD